MTADTPSETTDPSPSTPLAVEGQHHLEEIVVDHDVVLVDFYADWCGPCKMLEPILEDLADETVATVAKVDVDANQQLAGEYGVRGVPTIVVFAGGEQVDQHTGALPADRLRSIVDEYTN